MDGIMDGRIELPGVDPADMAMLVEAGILAMVHDGTGDGETRGGVLGLPRADGTIGVVGFAGVGPCGPAWEVLHGSIPRGATTRPLAGIVADLMADVPGTSAIAALGLLSADPGSLVAEARHWAGIPAPPAADGRPLPAELDLSVPESGSLDPACTRFHGWNDLAPGHPPGNGILRCGPRPRAIDTATMAAIERAIGTWVRAMARAMGSDGQRVPDAPTWSIEIQGWLNHPDQGRFRRQAIALHPAYAPLCMIRPVGELIDAGRPFEPELSSYMFILFGKALDDDQECYPPALMRRLRAMPPSLWGPDVARLARLANGMPLHRVPTDAEGWRAMAIHARAVMPYADRFAVDPLPLLSSSMAAGDPVATLHGLQDAVDMVEEMAVSLVAGMFTRRSTNSPALRWIANALLFDGASVPAIVDTVRTWHALHRRPSSRDPVAHASWPALFGPFDAGDGISIVCLADADSLTDEGTAGPDRHGIEGMAHCVGGYAGHCATGNIHVASVRRAVDGPAFERLSTVSLSLAAPNGPGPARASVIQHRGRSNARPCAIAEDAVALLLDHLAVLPVPDPVLGRMEESRKAGHADTFGQRDALEDLRAWRPYLPAHLRDLDLDALSERAYRLGTDLTFDRKGGWS
jgi:hypothetical protein